MNKVKVTADKDGNVICGLKKSEKDGQTYGYIRVEQVLPKFSGNFGRNEVRSALIAGTEAFLRSLGWAKDMAIEGKIVFKESTSQPHPSVEPKKAGENGGLVTIAGRPIYRLSEYTTDMSKQDLLIQHDAIGVAVTASALNA